MGKAKDKILIPTYEMETAGFYLLLRVRMEKRGCRNINGVGKAFFAPETYKNGRKLLANLRKRDMVSEQNGEISLREGLEKALDIILDSPHCMNFQNALLGKREEVLTFYSAKGVYVGVLQGPKNAMVVMAEEEDAVYKAFEKRLEDKTVSNAFQPEKWNALWAAGTGAGEREGIAKPHREARITHCGNRMDRERFNVAMVADGRQLQIIRGADSLRCQELNRETAAPGDWYGVICQELERLKAENQRKGGEGTGKAKKEAPRKKSEYQQVTSAPDFPKSRMGFVFWSLKRVVKGLPRMVAGMVRKKSLALLLYPLWGAVLVFYNLYITCYFNNTFMLDRRARLGNLSPYVMAGTLRTPSSLKGLQMNWGLIDTVFLVWPLTMVLTLLIRHVVLQIKQRKAGFLVDLAHIPGAVRDCGALVDGKKKAMWTVFALVWVLGFLIMNPITLFLTALLLLLLFAQGTRNSLVQIVFLWACAGGRKKIDAGQKPEPDSRKYRLLLFYGSMGFAIYGIVSVLLWFAVDYHWWLRLAVTVLMVLFALLQIFMPGAISQKLRSRTAVLFLLCLVVLCAAAIFGSEMGLVLADDGGWSESGGTIAGLIQNAGFSAILGLSLLVLGLGLGFPLVGVGIVSLAAGLGTFGVGLTDTKLGNYVKKSARQYFFGAEKGENKTFFCTLTEVLNFASGFVNPAGLTGNALKIFQGGKLAGDIVSTIGDAMGTVNDFGSYLSGSQDTKFGDLMLDILGLGLDFYGMKGDLDDFNKVMDTAGITGDDLLSPSLREQYQEIENARDQELIKTRDKLKGEMDVAIRGENNRHQEAMDRIQNTIRGVEDGSIEPDAGLSRDGYLRKLQDDLLKENAEHTKELSNIRANHEESLRDASSVIKEHSFWEKGKLALDVVDKANSWAGEGKNIYDFLDSNGFFDNNTGTTNIDSGGIFGSGPGVPSHPSGNRVHGSEGIFSNSGGNMAGGGEDMSLEFDVKVPESGEGLVSEPDKIVPGSSGEFGPEPDELTPECGEGFGSVSGESVPERGEGLGSEPDESMPESGEELGPESNESTPERGEQLGPDSGESVPESSEKLEAEPEESTPESDEDLGPESDESTPEDNEDLSQKPDMDRLENAEMKELLAYIKKLFDFSEEEWKMLLEKWQELRESSKNSESL